MKLEVGMIARTNKGLLIDIIHDFDSKLCAYKILNEGSDKK